MAGFRSLTPSTLITARSFDSEVPTILAVAVVPLSNVTVMCPPGSAACNHVIVGQDVAVLVQHHAAADAAAAAAWTVIVTSDGSILAAAAATVPSGVGACGAAPLVTLTGEAVPSSAR